MLAWREYGYWLRALSHHARNARRSRSGLLRLQEQKFRRLVAYAAARSPYYAAVMRRLQLDPETCRPEDFPVLTKQDLIDRFDELVTDPRIRRRDVVEFATARRDPQERFRRKYRVSHTTGTTGERAYLVYSEREWVQGLSLVARVPSPTRFRKRIASLLPSCPGYVSVQLTSALQRGPASWFVNIEIFPIDWDLKRIIDELNRFQPHHLTGFVGHMKLLAEAQAAGSLHIRPIEVSTGGEQLRSQDRSQIEDAFGVRMSNIYACNEGLYLGLNLDDDDGLYLQEDEVVFELHADHLCITPLYNYTLPIIRYRLDDKLTPEPRADTSLPFRRVSSVVGRQDFSLAFQASDGRQDLLTFCTIYQIAQPGVATMQAVQESNSLLTLRVRFCDGVSDQEKLELAERMDVLLRDLLGKMRLDYVHSRVCEAPDLNSSKTGKFMHVVPLAVAQRV